MIDDLIIRIGWTLVHSVWQAALIAIVLAALFAFGLRLSSNARYLVCLLALLAVVGVAAGTFVQQRLPARPTHRATAVAQLIEPIEVAPIVLPQVTQSAVARSRTDLNQLMPWVAGVWVVGIVVLSSWQFGGWILLRRLRSNAVAIDPVWAERFDRLKQIMKTPRAILATTARMIDVPVVIGVLKPIVLAPAAMLSEMSVQQVEAILAHELAHVKRRDYLVNLIQTAIETLLFYHPAVWWIGRQIRREREHCCDEIAARVCGDRTTVAQALAAMEETRVLRLALAARSGGRSELLVRVRRLLGAKPAPARRSRCWAAGAALVLASIALVMPHPWVRAQTTAPAGLVVQPAPGKAEPSPIGPDDFVVDNRPYLLEPNDVVRLIIGEEIRLERISGDGVVQLPLIGPRKISGLSQQQAQQTIEGAYKDANLAPERPPKLVITEQRGRMFSLFGAVNKPGQFVVPANDFKLFDALSLGGGAAKRSKVKVFRGQRLITIPPDQLDARDPQVNIIIRQKDFVFVEEPGLKPTRIVVFGDRIESDGKRTDWDQMRKMLEAIPLIDRRNLFIELSAGSGDLPVKDFFKAKSIAVKLVDDLKLAHVNEVGVEPGVPGSSVAR
jgi:beta-lactamase regulating signal transducer with metallopeptidase domain/protein involved in polysaccharide export with SLBB domain